MADEDGHLCIREDRGRYDFVWTERLSRIYEGGEDLARLPTFAWWSEDLGQRRHGGAERRMDRLFMEAGSGLLIPNGILGDASGWRDGWVEGLERGVD